MEPKLPGVVSSQFPSERNAPESVIVPQLERSDPGYYPFVSLQILLLEDRIDDVELIRLELEKGGIRHTLQCVETKAQFLQALSEHKPNLVLADFRLSDIDGLQALASTRELYPDIPFIMVTGALGEELALQTIRSGATDYILKHRLFQLVPAILRAMRETEQRSQREHAETELRQSEERFRQLTESIREVFWLRSAQNNELIYISPGYEQIWGRTCAGLYQNPKNWLDAIHPDDQARVGESALTKQVSGVYHEEYRILRPDGSIRWIQDRAFPVKDPSGGIYRIAGIAEDITRRKQAEESLQQAEAKYRSIYENAIEGIFQTTPEGRYISANPALARMLGYDSPEELVNSISDLSTQICANPQTRIALKSQLESQGLVRNFENEVFRKDKSRIWISLNAHVVRHEDGRIAYYEGACRDITERKHAEKITGALASLGYRLSAASSPKQAAGILLDASFDLIGWDFGAVYTLSLKGDGFTPLLILDRNGELLLGTEKGASEMFSDFQLITSQGGRVISPGQQGPDIKVGDSQNQRAGSEIRVPIRLGQKSLGVVSIQSRSRKAYSTDDLELLQTLADYCGAALERIRITEDLRLTESNFRSIFENATEGIFQATPDGRFVVANPALAQMFGYDSPKELMAREVPHEQTFVSPERLAELKRRVGEHGFVKGFQAERFRKNRTTFWVSMNVQAIRDETGKFILFQGTEQDITAQKHAELFMEAAEANYRELFENATEGIFRTTPDGRFLNANPALARILGYNSPDDLMLSVTDIGHQSYLRPEARLEIKRTLETDGKVEGFEVQGCRKNGSRVWVSINARSVYDQSGKIVCFAGTVQDITQRKSSIAALLESERQLRLIAENTTDVIFAFDMERRPVFVNPAVETLTGYTAAEVRDQKFINWIYPDDRERMLQLWEDLFAGKSYSDVEFRLITKSGHLKWCSSTWGPLFDEHGLQIGVQGRERDITERKNLERELVESTANERRRIGHELHDGLGQYLAGIAFRAKALEQTLLAKASEHAPDAAELAALVSNAISQTRSLARGLDPVEVETIGLPAALENLSQETEKFFEIRCPFRCPEAPLTIEPQVSLALYRIAQEAIHNAITHGEARRIEIDLGSNAGRLRLKIIDNGKGFEIKVKPQTGMGLRVMQYRARSIGADLKISSEQNKGTHVICLVPQRSTPKLAGVG